MARRETPRAAGRHGLSHHQSWSISIYNADGEMMFVAPAGNLAFSHESAGSTPDPGNRGIPRREIPREILSGPALGFRGTTAALYAAGARAVGANCLAIAPFLTPSQPIDKDTPTELREMGRALFVTRLPHSPVDVVAWHGIMRRQIRSRTFSPVGAIGFGSSRSVDLHGVDVAFGDRGTANIDFVIFRSAGRGGKHLRPPGSHDIMSDSWVDLRAMMPAAGFTRPALSLHNMMPAARPGSRGLRSASIRIGSRSS